MKRFLRHTSTAFAVPLAAAGGLILSALCGAGCRRPEPEPRRLQWETMGTVAAVQVTAPADDSRAREIAQAAFGALESELSAWREDSALAAVNRGAGGPAATPISSVFADVLRFSLDICGESGGAFNPLIGPVMSLWGFNGATPRAAPPGRDELAAAAALTDWRGVELRTSGGGISVRLPKAGMRLDLGAVAKGYAVDVAWERLTAAGCTNLLIDLGGNLRAIGEAARGRGGWRTGVRDPFEPDALIGQFLMRPGEAVATSGNYERFVEIGGTRYAHIMDSRTGTPVTGMAGTTVLAPTAALADALSTTIFVLGPEKGAALLLRHPGCEALWIPDAPASPTLYATAGMAARFTPFAGARAYRLVVVRPPQNTNTQERRP